MSVDLKKARDHLTAIMQSARSGGTVDVGQLEVLGRMLDAVEAERTRAAIGTDLRSMMTENADFWKTAIHELRTPMTSIRGYSDMLAKPEMGGALSEMQLKLLGVVRANSRRMELLLADFSVLNKLRSGILPIKPKLDTVKNVAMMVEKRVEPTIEDLGRSFKAEVPNGLPMLQTDGEHLSMALAKLVENGLRYSPAQGGKVELTATTENAAIHIIVSDNGIGMSEAEVAQLGTPYFRADNEVVRSYKGSGLGVAIAYSLLAALGGSIRVTSAPGKGTRWTVQMPAMGVR
ncbi:MAG: HAMP domain-containing histidine kinase [Chloroflexi bacterium]|jgi:signal transduction histidine kinase|nr:MAG: putative two-component hybrid sensor and regulator [Chloroflexi bacterium OLB13]MBV6437384.1 Alkaline phosphatase synthesis sensor protein PhoR [Anaerolineae bacterium]MCC6566953.1 HAMP domain-containing histidine kinase [Chloroflexota bacterium]MBW7878123.1 HAMP domain-containing histidine kinase [Anaerolineae bacterium]MCO6443344.1 HAMP domain-containing histidine kinase [Anaerolineae bacterium]